MLISLIATAAVGVCEAAERLTMYGSCADFAKFALADAKWDAAAGGITYSGASPNGAVGKAVVDTPEVAVPGGFDHLIPSWNASTPPGSYLCVYANARVDGDWIGWYKMELWNKDGRPEARTSYKYPKDPKANVDTDTFILKKKADAYKLRVELCSVDGKVYPSLRFLCASVKDTSVPDAATAPVKGVWGKELDVPELCQLSVEGGNVWCSPTSTAMVLGYWSKETKRPELTVGITETAKSIFDKSWGGTGNWVFNTAFAGEFSGIRAYVTRFESVSQIEQWIAKGVPVIVSVDYNRLNRRNTTATMGHLMVIRGFTEDGSPIFNDPWAHLEKGEKVRKVFKREDLEYGWLGAKGSQGTVYIIHPEGYASVK